MTILTFGERACVLQLFCADVGATDACIAIRHCPEGCKIWRSVDLVIYHENYQ